jgi:hypothetical protein
MSDTKFTPGPWRVELGDGYPHAGSWCVVCDTHPSKYTPLVAVQDFDDRSEADARLIAAAPDIYDALILALPYVETAESDDAYKPSSARRVTETIRAALAKAVQP